MGTNLHIHQEFEECGRVWMRKAISASDLALFDQVTAEPAKAGQRLGSSTALDVSLSNDGSLANAVRRLDQRATPVRAVSFNKSDNANWGVPWHQDRVIAVGEKVNAGGYHNWTRKSGTWHCEPPQFVLDQMLFVRVHLDDTNLSNGAMQIAVGSHKGGIVSAADAEAEANAYPIEVCEAQRGDVLILKMLTLHCSKPAKVHSGRRVLRVDFSSYTLPPPLAWNDQSA